MEKTKDSETKSGETTANLGTAGGAAAGAALGRSWDRSERRSAP